jgi:hypothetical protein
MDIKNANPVREFCLENGNRKVIDVYIALASSPKVSSYPVSWKGRKL